MAVQEALSHPHADGVNENGNGNGNVKTPASNVLCQTEKKKTTCVSKRKSTRTKDQLIENLAGNLTKPDQECADEDNYCEDKDKVKFIEIKGSAELIEIQPNGTVHRPEDAKFNKGFLTSDVDKCDVVGAEEVSKILPKRRIIINLDDKNKFTDEVTV